MSAGCDPAVATAHVRFAPKADKKRSVSVCPFCARGRHMQCSKRPVNLGAVGQAIGFLTNYNLAPADEKDPRMTALRRRGKLCYGSFLKSTPRFQSATALRNSTIRTRNANRLLLSRQNLLSMRVTTRSHRKEIESSSAPTAARSRRSYHSPANRTPSVARAASAMAIICRDFACVITGLSSCPARISSQKWAVS